MRESDKNLAVIQNFILHVTHCSNDVSELDWKRTMNLTPKELYEHCDDYIAEDHVDGRENPEDEIDEIAKAKKTLRDAGYFTDNLWHIEDVKHKVEEELDDETCQEFLEQALTSPYIMEQIQFTLQEYLSNEFTLTY